MSRLTLIGIVVCAAAFVVAKVETAQEPAKGEALLQRLGPDPFVVPPHSLAQLVSQAPAAVIAEIVGPGELSLESIPTSHGLFNQGFAPYRVMVRDVLFNRLEGQAPPLIIGSEVEFIQRVGRGMAAKFLARQIPVAGRDQCLLFLWYEPAIRAWEILQWPAQFRRSGSADGRAHGVAPMGEMRWVGPMVPARREAEDVSFDWGTLVAEVRRLSRAQGRNR